MIAYLGRYNLVYPKSKFFGFVVISSYLPVSWISVRESGKINPSTTNLTYYL